MLITVAGTACGKAKPMSLADLKAQNGVMLSINRDIDAQNYFEISYDGSIMVSTTTDSGSYYGSFNLSDDELYDIYTNAFSYSYDTGDSMLSSLEINSENINETEISVINGIMDSYLELVPVEEGNSNTLYEASNFTIIATPYGNYSGEEESCEIMLFQGESVTIGDVTFEVFFVDDDMVVLTTDSPLCSINDGSINIYDEHYDFSLSRGQSVQMAYGNSEDGVIFTVNQL